MNMTLLSAATAGLKSTTALTTPPAAPAPAPTTPAAPTAGTEELQVVSLADANAAIAAAKAEGAATEMKRTQDVLSSASGKAHASTAIFMLNANPTATAAQIIGHLDTLPAPTAAPAASTETPTTPAAPAAPTAPAATLTVPLDTTPKVQVDPNANSGQVEDKTDPEKFWGGFTAQAPAPQMLAGGVRPTGN